MGSEEESVTDFGACFSHKVVSLVIEILVRLRTNDVARTHPVSLCFRRSSSWRCFPSQ